MSAQELPTPPVVPMAPAPSTTAYWVARLNTHEDRFFGRKCDLDNLDSAPVDSRVVAASGRAGVGKSQLVTEYIHHAGRDCFWTAAGHSTAQTLAGLAQHLRVEQCTRPSDEIANDVRHHLTNLLPDTLWIVDNLADIALAESTSEVKLLATTRDGRGHLLAGSTKFLGLQAIGEQYAIDLRCSHSRTHPNDAHLTDIARVVGPFRWHWRYRPVGWGSTARHPRESWRN